MDPVFHKKLPPAIEGVAVSVVEFPSHMVGLFMVTDATGLTKTVVVAVAGQPRPET